MNTIDGLKTCKKGLHQYFSNLKQCPECQKIIKKRWQEKNREKHLESGRKWYAKNREKLIEKRRNLCEEKKRRRQELSRLWYEKNKKIVKERSKAWYANNLERARELGRQKYRRNRKQRVEYGRKWRQKNLNKISFYAAKRRALKKQATPSWADEKAINNFYTTAAELRKITRQPYHVDHIYPLVNPYLCGLHVETNLQILPGEENLKKSNRAWPGQLECQRLPLLDNGFQEIFDKVG